MGPHLSTVCGFGYVMTLYVNDLRCVGLWCVSVCVCVHEVRDGVEWARVRT